MTLHLRLDDIAPVYVESTSAKKDKDAPRVDTLSTIIPVQLSPEDMKAFVTAFHPKRAAKAPHAFLEAARFMAEVSAYLDAIFAGLRYGMSFSRSMADKLDASSLGDGITRDIGVAYNGAAELDKKSKDFLMSMAQGSHHIIRDSIRYKGGKDILYVGLRGANVSPLLSSAMPQTIQLPLLQSSYSYESNKEHYETAIAKALVETGLLIQRLLFGESVDKLSSAYTRINGQHQVGGGANLIQSLQSIFIKGPLAKLGVPVMLPAFKGTVSDHMMRRLPEYTSFFAVREPVHQIVLTRSRSKDLPDESLGICQEAQALQPDIRFSFAINLPKKFCEYITQTKDEPIPLVPLNTWAAVWSAAMLRPPKTRSSASDRAQRAQGTRVLVPERAPKYVLRPSASDALIARRKELGLYSEQGRVNEDGLFITYNGDLAFLNTAEDSALPNAKAYEKLSEEALGLSFEAGTPLAAGQRGSTGVIFDLASPHYAEKIAQLKDSLGKYKGSVQAINWDLNSVLTVSVADPDRLVSTKLTGGAKPEALNMATYMRLPFNKGMYSMFSRTRVADAEGRKLRVSSDAFADTAVSVIHCSVFTNFAHLYNHLLKLGKVPALKDLVDAAAANFKISSLDDPSIADYEVLPLDANRTIYKQIIGKDLTVFDPGERTGQAILALLGVAATQAAAKPGTNLMRICLRDNIEFTEHDRYFDGLRSPVGDFARLYTWLGGEVFHMAAQAILDLPRKELLEIHDVPLNPEDPEDGHPGFLSIVNEVMPMCVMLGKYTAPEIRDKIYKEADAIKERQSELTEQDLNLAGSRGKDANGKGGFKLFPHQAEALVALKAHPKIAILDIAPGGGKTSIGIADIACLYADGLIKRPFVFAPNRLVRNWIEDCHKSFAGWNTIPVTTETYAEWGEERLTKMIMEAPPNTIVIVGNSFISNTEKTQLVIGNAVDNMSNSVEFCKKFQPDYIIIDESHRIRNPRSAIHQGIKTIMQMSSVKYGRIATGTLIQNVLSDVVGQSAVFNGQIFRTLDEFDEEHKGVVAVVNDKKIIDYMDDTPMKARRRLAEFATVISFKKKEWAFMLPIPIERFITVDMEVMTDPNNPGSKIPDEHGHKLQLFYNSVLNRTLKEMREDPKIGKKKKKDEDDEGDDSDDEVPVAGHHVVSANGANIDVTDEDDDSDSDDELEAALQPYLQRLERLLTDPFGDPDLIDVAKEIFGADYSEDFARTYATPKVAKVIERIKLHFAENPWQKGKLYSASDMVDFNGKSYIFKSDLPAGHGEERSDMAPDSDPNWKPQIRGKVFVACRYTRSVDAIYRALPASLRDKTVRFHGDVDNKDDNLARFQSDDKVQILIGNEMGISEGHNFQMASRFIRVEAPWAPGELDQTASRIFRPDVGGEYARQTIFLDWILCDNTLEIAKMGRLISKMLKRTKFDELDNPKYYKELNPANLPIIKMSLENIQQLYKFNDLCSLFGDGSSGDIHPHSYIGQYRYLVSETGQEFREMRATKRAYMMDVEPTKMPDTAKRIDFVPWVPNQRVEDLDNDGLLPLKATMEDEDNELAQAFRKDHRALIGQFVRTEFGVGVIDKVTTKRGSSSDEGEDDAGNEISKVRVKLSQGGNVEMLSASKVFLATNITERNKTKYNKKAPQITEADKKRTAKNLEKAEKVVARVKAKTTATREALRKQAAKPVKETPPPKAKDTGKTITLYPVIYNEFLALEGFEDDADSKLLKRFGFTRFAEYAYLPIKTAQAFNAALDYIEDRFTISPKTVSYLDMLADSFQSGRGRKFDVQLAPVAEFPQFYRMRHTVTVIKNKRKPELKLYPVLLNGNLMLVVDLTTNPVFRKQLGKTIPGMAGTNKFQEAEGMDIHFFRNKTDLIAKVKELRAAGFTITNLNEIKEETAKLSLKTLTRGA